MHTPAFPCRSAEGAAWARAEVEEARQRNLVDSSYDNNYQKPITRLEFSHLILDTLSAVWGYSALDQVIGSPDEIQDTFVDTTSIYAVAANRYYIVLGWGDGGFHPDNYITRQEAATMLARAGTMVLNLTAGPAISFNDREQIAGWAVDSVDYVSGLLDPVTGGAVMNGNGTGGFSPLGNYSREQAFLTALRLYHAATFADTVQPTNAPTPRPAATPAPTPRPAATPTPTAIPTPTPAPVSTVRDTQALKKLIHDGIWRGDKDITFRIADYIPAGWDIGETLVNLGRELSYEPDMFAFVSASWDWDSTSTFASCHPVYDSTVVSDYSGAKQLYREGIADITAGVDPGWTTVAKLLYLNSEVCLRFRFADRANTNAYKMLRYGSGNCEGHSMLMCALLDEVGIPSLICRSSSLEHT